MKAQPPGGIPKVGVPGMLPGLQDSFPAGERLTPGRKVSTSETHGRIERAGNKMKEPQGLVVCDASNEDLIASVKANFPSARDLRLRKELVALLAKFEGLPKTERTKLENETKSGLLLEKEELEQFRAILQKQRQQAKKGKGPLKREVEAKIKDAQRSGKNVDEALKNVISRNTAYGYFHKTLVELGKIESRLESITFQLKYFENPKAVEI